MHSLIPLIQLPFEMFVSNGICFFTGIQSYRNSVYRDSRIPACQKNKNMRQFGVAHEI